MKRREFSRAVRAEIVKRATRDSQIYCEGCGILCKGAWHIDHTIPDALQVDKRSRLTADDGKLLCAGSRDSCHGIKTAEQDQPDIAKAKRREAAHLGVTGARSSLSVPRAVRKARAEQKAEDRRGPGKPPVPAPRALFRERMV